MKLSEYARKNNITYRTAHRHWKQGLITGKQLNTGTIVVLELTNTHQPIKNLVVLCARVSNRCAEATENKTNLETQLNRLRDYATAKGYTIVKEIRETGSGLHY